MFPQLLPALVPEFWELLSHLEFYSLMHVPFEIYSSSNLHVLLSESYLLTPTSPSLKGAGSHTHALKI